MTMTSVAAPRRKRIRLPRLAYRQGDPFLITICSARGTLPFRDERTATIARRHLERCRPAGGGPVVAWWLMPDHLHVVLAGASDVVAWARRFKSGTAGAAVRAGLRGPLWQRSFHDRCLSCIDPSLESVVRYVVENPVRAGLASRAEDWPYSAVWLDEEGPTERPRPGKANPTKG